MKRYEALNERQKLYFQMGRLMGSAPRKIFFYLWNTAESPEEKKALELIGYIMWQDNKPVELGKK